MKLYYYLALAGCFLSTAAVAQNCLQTAQHASKLVDNEATMKQEYSYIPHYCQLDASKLALKQIMKQKKWAFADQLIALSAEQGLCDLEYLTLVGDIYAAKNDVEIAACYLNKAKQMSLSDTEKSLVLDKIAAISSRMPSVSATELSCSRTLGAGIAKMCTGMRGKSNLSSEKGIYYDATAGSAQLKIHFDYRSHQLNTQGKSELNEVVSMLASLSSKEQQVRMRSPGIAAVSHIAQPTESVKHIVIVGHTDEQGADDVNDELSQQRAKTVANAIKQQFPNFSLNYEGRGESDPIIPGARYDNDHAVNRRVEIFIK